MFTCYLRRKAIVLIGIISAVLPIFLYAQPVITFNPVITSGLSSPLDIVNANDGTNRLFIVERGGSVKIAAGGALTGKTFINLADSIISGGEQGLLSLAFHPDYENNRYFFVYYTRDDDEAVTIARYQTSIGDPDAADPLSGVELLTIPKPSGFDNHNGGKLNFGPDGYLYFATGDGGGGGDPGDNAQDSMNLRGKMIRIDVNNFNTPPFYSIPADNPFVGNPNVRPEIWALGLRNPWRWSFDRFNGNMWIADVGQNLWEEVNVRSWERSDSVNYGWRCFEGNATFNTTGCSADASDYVSPIFAYPHDATGGFAVTGGYVYRGPDYPSIYGYYIMADFSTGNVWKIYPNASTAGWYIFPQTGPASISSFGEDENGVLYAVTLTGTLYRVEGPPGAALPLRLINFQATWQNDVVALSWETTAEENMDRFDVEYSLKGDVFTPIGTVLASNFANGNKYRFEHRIASTKSILYRLKMVNIDGTYEYSNVITLSNPNFLTTGIYPTVIQNSTVNLYLAEPYNSFVVVGMDGRIILQRTITGQTGNVNIQLPRLTPGTYLVQLLSTAGNWQQKIIIR